MSISNDDFESFRQSVNGVYCRGEKMTVKGEKHTSDPRKYKQWLMDEKQKQLIKEYTEELEKTIVATVARAMADVENAELWVEDWKKLRSDRKKLQALEGVGGGR